MAAMHHQLKKGKTLFDALDIIEEEVVKYMASKRQLSELEFRELMFKNAEVLASYLRKIGRSIRAYRLNTSQLVGK